MEFGYAGRRFSVESDDAAIIGSPLLVADLAVSPDFRSLAFVASHRFLEAQLPSNHFGIGGSITLFDNPVIGLTADGAACLEADLRDIGRRLAQRGRLFYEESIGAAALAMMYDLFEFHAARDNTVRSTDRASYVVRRLMDLLSTGVCERRRSVGYFAAQLNVTPKYLSDTVRRQTGLSVTHFIDVHTVPILKRYLDDASLSVTMIAERMDFSSPSYFARYVRRLLGLSPAEYRSARMPVCSIG
ncbi:MAG: helix-turn-helix domain-containing protein [Alistipes sp.]